VLPVNGSLHMAPLFPRSGPGESSSPMSQVVLRCYDFPPRLSGRLFGSLPGSTLPSSVRVSQLALALPEDRRVPSGPGSMFNRRPNCRLHRDIAVGIPPRAERRRDRPGNPSSILDRHIGVVSGPHVDVSGISQVPRRSILCLCLGLGPRPNQRAVPEAVALSNPLDRTRAPYSWACNRSEPKLY
jgi:hypothetical protein